MLIDIFGELNSDFYPMYLYATIIVTALCSYGILYVTTEHFKADENLFRSNYTINFHQSTDYHILGHIHDIRVWITKKMKRKDGPDDDTDPQTFSNYNQLFNIRGGQRCLNNLYSLSLKNIALHA